MCVHVTVPSFAPCKFRAFLGYFTHMATAGEGDSYRPASQPWRSRGVMSIGGTGEHVSSTPLVVR